MVSIQDLRRYLDILDLENPDYFMQMVIGVSCNFWGLGPLELSYVATELLNQAPTLEDFYKLSHAFFWLYDPCFPFYHPAMFKDPNNPPHTSNSKFWESFTKANICDPSWPPDLTDFINSFPQKMCYEPRFDEFYFFKSRWPTKHDTDESILSKVGHAMWYHVLRLIEDGTLIGDATFHHSTKDYRDRLVCDVYHTLAKGPEHQDFSSFLKKLNDFPLANAPNFFHCLRLGVRFYFNGYHGRISLDAAILERYQTSFFYTGAHTAYFYEILKSKAL